MLGGSDFSQSLRRPGRYQPHPVQRYKTAVGFGFPDNGPDRFATSLGKHFKEFGAPGAEVTTPKGVNDQDEIAGTGAGQVVGVFEAAGPHS